MNHPPPEAADLRLPAAFGPRRSLGSHGALGASNTQVSADRFWVKNGSVYFSVLCVSNSAAIELTA